MEPFGRNRHGPKIGGLRTLLGRGAGSPSNTKSPSCIQPFGHNRNGPKIWEAPPPFWGGAGSPSNTKSPVPRPTSIPCAVLIYPAIWPQQIRDENWGTLPLWERGAVSAPNTMWPGPRPTGMPSCILIHPTVLATIHQRYRQDRQTDRQTTV